MIDINDYMKRSKVERQMHLQMNEPCIERGANAVYTSTMCKGLLAHILDTTLPTGYKIHCCHACHNNRCSNPNHLYWGTAKENYADAVANGRIGVFDASVRKYGIDRVREMASETGKKYGARGGAKGKGKGKKKNIARVAELADAAASNTVS